jgi:hypothetical protein
LSFHPKTEKRIKAAKRHLPKDTPLEDITAGFIYLGFDVISVKQMITARPSHEGGHHTIILPLFLIFLQISNISQGIFNL